MSYRIGIDTGGTFTDLVLVDETSGEVFDHKVPSTPEDPAKAILSGLGEMCAKTGASPAQLGTVIHGTTVATNAILERKGVRTALLTTAGFRDVLHIMRQDRPKLYDFRARRPLPLVPRRLRLEVRERILADGTVLLPLDEAQMQDLADQLRHEAIQSLAVCFLHSYRNPEHEQRARGILEQELPELEITLSSDLLPEFKEYERMSTAVINAYVQPILKNYMHGIQRKLGEREFQPSFYVMKSNGGVMDAATAADYGVHTILSGPAGGALGGILLSERTGRPNLITADMGGTSFDVALVSGGRIGFAREVELGGHLLKVPMLDIHTIGAGGGSIAWTDPGGALRAGPESAGADPGPVAYGRGGTEPTVTDANLVLGRLSAGSFLGGAMEVDEEAARQAILDKIARPLGMDLMPAAEGILRVINAAMAKGIRHVSVERGHDPRDFSLVAFGGAGPLHAVLLARNLGMPEVIIPPAPGLASAHGLLEADLRQDYSKTFLEKLNQDALNQAKGHFQRMESAAREFLGDGEILFERELDLRYTGQGFEIVIPFSSVLEETIENFHGAHLKQYGFHRREVPVDLVNLRLAAIRPVRKLDLRPRGSNPRLASLADKGSRNVFLDGRVRSCRIRAREALSPGCELEGPAVVEQRDSTTILCPGDKATVDEYGNLIIQVQQRNA